MSEVHDRMLVDWDVAVPMRDGAVLRADVFRPITEEPVPVIMTAGPYGKGVAFQEGFAGMWTNLVRQHPEVESGSSGRFQNWETVDPEKWVPDGYACVRVDSRGAGRSEGYLDLLSAQEIDDFADAIEWFGTQPWSNGRVGLLGVSYYAMNQWLVAARRPPHLAAIVPWEGSSDLYREFARHGGILNDFTAAWYPRQIASVQHGVGERGFRNPVTGVTASGPPTMDPAQLEANRADMVAEIRDREFLDDWYLERIPALEEIDVPVLSAANWAHWLHTRGNFEAFERVGSRQKWLEVHGLEHYAEFYTDYGVALQKRFLGHFLRDEDTGWNRQPRVRLRVRTVDGAFIERDEDEWPLARTEWTPWYLDPTSGSFGPSSLPDGGAVEIDVDGTGATFWSEPLESAIEITGPAAATLVVSTELPDVDLFVTLRVQDPDGEDVTFVSGLDPHGVVAAGWLRATHRELDPLRSLPHRPWHRHERPLPLEPDVPTELQVEIWPTSVIVPEGYRIGVVVGGSDFAFDGDGPWPVLYGIEMRGHGMFTHTDAQDRARARPGTFRLHRGSKLLLPLIPR